MKYSLASEQHSEEVFFNDEFDLSEKDIFPLESAACWRQYVKPLHMVLFSTAKNILKMISTQGMRLPEQVYLRAGFDQNTCRNRNI